MSDRNPASILYDSNSVELAVTSSVQIVSGSKAIIVAGVGSDGVTRFINVDSAFALKVTGSMTTSPSGFQQVTGSVGITNVVVVNGTIASGSTFSGQSVKPIVVAGLDASGSVRIPLYDTDGSQFFKRKEEATFFVSVTGSAIGNNKSMASIVNGTTTQIVKIKEVWLLNVQTVVGSGALGTFEFRRISGHASGTAVVGIEQMDTIDVLDPGLTVRTNAVVSGESTTLLWRTFWSTDNWGPGSLNQEGYDHGLQSLLPAWQRRDQSSKPLTLRANEGLTIKHVVNSISGTFDLMIGFTTSPTSGG